MHTTADVNSFESRLQAAVFIVAHAASLRLSRMHKVDFDRNLSLKGRKLAACATKSGLKAELKTIATLVVDIVDNRRQSKWLRPSSAETQTFSVTPRYLVSPIGV